MYGTSLISPVWHIIPVTVITQKVVIATAVAHINTEIRELLLDRPAEDQQALDQMMLDADGTDNKQRLGANAMLAVSLAAARAVANGRGVELYEHLADVDGSGGRYTMPVPMMNILNGGEHADNNVDIQEFMILPVGFPNFSEALRCGAEIFHTLKRLLNERGVATAVGDEGGFAPMINKNEDALSFVNWQSNKTNSKIVLAIHGYNDYSNAFEKPAKYLSKFGIKVAELTVMFVKD